MAPRKLESHVRARWMLDAASARGDGCRSRDEGDGDRDRWRGLFCESTIICRSRRGDGDGDGDGEHLLYLVSVRLTNQSAMEPRIAESLR